MVIFDDTLSVKDVMTNNLLTLPVGTDLKVACITLLERHIDGIGIKIEPLQAF